MSYPTDDELNELRSWIITGVVKQIKRLSELWTYSDGIKITHEKNEWILELHTYGWSGNEDIIGALTENYLWWSMFWYSSKRGGHYIFKIPDKFYE